MSSVLSRSTHPTRVDALLASARRHRGLLLLTFAIVVGVSIGMYGSTVSVKSRELAVVRAEGRGKGVFNFRDGREVSVEYRGSDRAVNALRNGQAAPAAVAVADLDHNGTPDLISGYSANGIGLVTVQHGNPDAFAPTDQSVFPRIQQGYNPEPLLPSADIYETAITIEHLVVGDFDDNADKDVLIASAAGGAYLMKNDGRGVLGNPEQIQVAGTITALAAGEFAAADGHGDVAVGVSGPSGRQLLIYDGIKGGVAAEPISVSLSAAPTVIKFGDLDGDPFVDIAIVAAGQIQIIHGWGRKQNVSLASRVESVSVAAAVRSLDIGFFVWNREYKKQLATVGEDGTVRILQRGEQDERPFSEKEIFIRSQGRANQKRDPAGFDLETVEGWKAGDTSWTISREISTSSMNTNADAQNLLSTSSFAPRETNDLVVLGAPAQALQVIRQADPPKDAGEASLAQSPGSLMTVDLESTSGAAAIASLPMKVNGERNVVLLQTQSAQPALVPLAVTATPTVDRFDDPVVIAATCNNAVANDCSLRGAVQLANANPGSTITLPAGTYTLNINGAGGCTKAGETNSNGDLEINADNTTITGAGAATTIVRQIGTGNATFPGDRVICLNVPIAANIDYVMSGFTITGGRDTTALAQAIGGGGLVGGAPDNTLSLTNMTISNNQATGVGNFGGGGVQITGGSLTITNSLLGGTNAPGANRNDETLANSEVQAGGGLTYSPGAPFGGGGPGTLTITGTTFQRNVSASGASGGGGADLLIHNLGSGSGNISTSSFLNNQATAASGAGLIIESLPTTVATTSFTSNSAANLGGGIYIGGGSLALNGTVASITFSGNTATNGATSVGANGGPVTVSGTNTTIGGSVAVFTNGTWTNNVGSSLSPTDFSVIGGTLTCNNSTMNISGNFTLGHEASKSFTLNANSATFNIQGNLSADLNNGGSGATGVFSAGTSTFNFNGTGTQSISNSGVGAPITFNNLTDSNTTQPLTINNSLNVAATLSVNGVNAIFDPVAAATIGGAGTLNGTGTARTRAAGGFSAQYTITNKTLTNLTVEYIGAVAQTGSAITYGPLKINNGSGVNIAAGTMTVNALLTLQAGALGVGTQTLVINNGSTVIAGSITSGASGTVNYNQSSNGQDVRAFNYGNLTFSNFNKVLAGTGTIGVAGVFTPGTAVGHTIAGSTINFNGTGAQTIPAFNYWNLSTSNARGSGLNITLVNGGTIGIAGAFSPTATFSGGGAYVITNNTVDYNGSGAQTIAAFNYNNLTSSNVGSRTLQNGGTIGIAGAFTVGTNTYTVTNSTVNFNGSALQSIPIFTFNNLTLTNAAGANMAGNVTVGGALFLAAGALGVGTNTLTLNGAVSFGAGSLTSATTGTVIYNQGSNGQATVLAANYGNLTFSSFNKTLASSGTIGIAGVFTPGAATGHTITGSTINFNGSGAQTIPGFTYNNLTSSSTGARTLDPVNTIKIAGVFTPGTNVYTITGSTVEYNGSALQTLPTTFITYNNLTLNNPAGTTGFAGLTVQGLITVAAGTFTSSSTYNNVQINAGATLAGVAATTINVSGNWTNNGGTFTPNSNTVNFNGTGAQTIGGTSATQTFNNLTVNKSSNSLTVGGSTTTLNINGNLLITAGVFNAGTATAINVGGNWTNNTGLTAAFVPGVSVVIFNNTVGPQTINGTAVTQAFNHFTVAKTAQTLSVGGSTTTLDIGGNLTINTGTFNGPATINLIGNWTNGGGTFGAGSGIVNFNGGGPQTIGGALPTTFNNLTVNNGTGLAMNSNNTVNGILALTSGDITVGSTFLLTQPNTGSSTGGFDVIGSLKRTGFVSGGAALTFGNPFNSIQINSGTAPTDITVNLAKTTPPNPIAYPNAVQRTYTITPTGGSGIAATLRLHYLDSELNGNMEGAGLNLWQFVSPLWRFRISTAFDTTNNWVEKNGLADLSGPWTMNSTNAPTATNGLISGRITNPDGSPVVGAVVRLTGTQLRKTITDATGFYQFNGIETSGFYTIIPSRANYSFNPSERSFSQVGERTEASFGGNAGPDSQNPLDTAEYFVRQQYVDLLGREPDEGGFNYWSDRIIECGVDTRCVSARRRDVAAAFFVEQEFQQTGSFIYGLYKGGLGRVPAFSEFSTDRTALVVGPQLDAMKQAYAESFVGRSEFVSKYAANTTAESFVDGMLANIQQVSGIDLRSQRAALIARYNGGSSLTQSRSFVVRDLTESVTFRQTEYNGAFVLTEYFGYLRRDPDAGGYAFWLNVLNNRDPGNFRGMVCAFITSAEYQQRFSGVVSRSDQECGQ